MTIARTAAAILLIAAPGWTSAQTPPPPPRTYLAPRAAGPPRIDGRLDDACWQAAPWTEDFIDIEGAAKPRPTLRTRAKIAWDDSHLYIAAQLEEPHVWATLAQHDSVIFRDNDFEVFIDPDGDNHNYFEFEINALNTGWDLFLNRPYQAGGKPDNSWEIPGLRTAVLVDGTLNNPTDTDRGWTVEMAFPWSAFERSPALRRPPLQGDRWRMNFSRVEWRVRIAGGKYEKAPGRAEDNWVWSPQGVINMHRPEMWGIVEFGGSKPGKQQVSGDPLWDVKMRLHAAYDAQREFKRKNGRYAANLEELGINVSGLQMQGRPAGYVLSLRPCTLDETALLQCAPAGPARQSRARR